MGVGCRWEVSTGREGFSAAVELNLSTDEER